MADTATILLFIFAILVLFSLDNWILTLLENRRLKIKEAQS